MLETYYGCVRTPVDAIKLFEACRIGLLPRVQRRLSEKERQAIRSGSVFVWDEREAGMRRWTDGKSWSASRVSGSFLTYREMEGKRGNAFGTRRNAGKTPDSGRGSDEDHDDGEPDGYRYKADGLMKQSFSITTSAGEHLHLISYYARGQHNLPQPSTDPHLKNIIPPKGMYPESSLSDTHVPAMTRTPMQQQPYLPHHHATPHPPYPPQYSPVGYAWPPSPISTPPYSHPHYSYPQGPAPLPPSHPYPPPPHAYQHGPPNPAYDRAPLSLPPPQMSAPVPTKPVMPYPQQLPHPPRAQPYAGHGAPEPSVLDSPRSQQLQAQAREAVMMDPRVSDAGTRSPPPGLLPPPGSQPHHHHHHYLQHEQQQQQQQQLNGASPNTIATSPYTAHPRAPSASPPRSASSDAKNGGAAMPLSRMLLHPDDTATSSTGAGSGNGSEPGSATTATAPTIAGSISPTGSPRGSQPADVAASAQGIAAGVDAARAIGMLNKNFYC